MQKRFNRKSNTNKHNHAITDELAQAILLVEKMHEYQLCDEMIKNLLLREVSSHHIDPIAFSLQSGLISLDRIITFLADALSIQSIDLSQISLKKDLLDFAQYHTAMIKHGLMPFEKHENILSVAMDQPYFGDKVAMAEQIFNDNWIIEPFFSSHISVHEAIDWQLTSASKVEPLITQLSAVQAIEQIVSPDQVIIKLVESLLLEAMQDRASDIHFDSNAYFVTERLRIDGVLIEKRKFNLDIWDMVKIRLKVLSHIDITENQLPQDGSFFIHLRNKDYDFRLSSLPAVHGESIVLRLNNQKSIVQLETLGFDHSINEQLKSLMQQPSGLILIAGPTGSGKTTTLYALLQTLNLSRINVTTLEDPVEHIMSGIRQTNVRPELGLDFAQGIRSLLRQDPDILLIGEIRDTESAELAIKASLTGHLVLATVHAASIKDIPNRMLSLLQNKATLYSQTLAILAQRLLRKLCQSCAGGGCQDCHYSGYFGRFAIMEYLVFDDKKMRKQVEDYDYEKLSDIAQSMVQKKLTDAKEVARVMGSS